MNPEITAVERLSWTLGDWRRPAGGRISAVIIGINLQPNAMTFASLLTPEKKQLLQVPGNLLVDISDLDKLGVKVGDSTELNGKRVRVAGTVSGMRSMGGVNIITSLYTARTLDPALLKTIWTIFWSRSETPRTPSACATNCNRPVKIAASRSGPRRSFPNNRSAIGSSSQGQAAAFCFPQHWGSSSASSSPARP